MKVMYLNGEKVYVERTVSLKGDKKWSYFDGTIQIVKHNEIIRALNCIFQHAEENTDETGHDLSEIIYGINKYSDHCTHKIHIDIADPRITFFDNQQKVKRAQRINRMKQAELTQEDRGTLDDEPRLIKGGLYRETASIAAEGLSKEFVKFMKEERGGVNN